MPRLRLACVWKLRRLCAAPRGTGDKLRIHYTGTRKTQRLQNGEGYGNPRALDERMQATERRQYREERRTEYLVRCRFEYLFGESHGCSKLLQTFYLFFVVARTRAWYPDQLLRAPVSDSNEERAFRKGYRFF